MSTLDPSSFAPDEPARDATPIPPPPPAPTRPWFKKKRFLIPIGLVLLVGIAGSLGDDEAAAPVVAAPVQAASPSAAAPSPTATVDEAAAKVEAEAAEVAAKAAEQEAADAAKKAEEEAKEAAAKEKEEAEAEEAARGTVAQQNALRKAESYLDYSAFSRKGLIDQLKYEGFSADDSTWAADSVDVDWKEQAAKKAESYLEYSAFSRSGLIDQLLYEGFTQKQAEYGVKQTGL